MTEILRDITLHVRRGSDPDTLKCQVYAGWNGDAIAETDKIEKGKTTGDFFLSSDGKSLFIESSGFSGELLFAQGLLRFHDMGFVLLAVADDLDGKILIQARNPYNGELYDLTDMSSEKHLEYTILYATDV